MMRLALPHMKDRPGAAVINVASISGWSPQLAMSGQYGAAKAALIFGTERWALEFLPASRPARAAQAAPASFSWLTSPLIGQPLSASALDRATGALGIINAELDPIRVAEIELG